MHANLGAKSAQKHLTKPQQAERSELHDEETANKQCNRMQLFRKFNELTVAKGSRREPRFNENVLKYVLAFYGFEVI